MEVKSFYFSLTLFTALFLSLLFLNYVSAAHFIVGKVNDSLDGISADGHKVVLWKPSVGLSDNITDTIGSSGNSGTSGYYLLDCELLNSPCVVGDVCAHRRKCNRYLTCMHGMHLDKLNYVCS